MSYLKYVNYRCSNFVTVMALYMILTYVNLDASFIVGMCLISLMVSRRYQAFHALPRNATVDGIVMVSLFLIVSVTYPMVGNPSRLQSLNVIALLIYALIMTLHEEPGLLNMKTYMIRFSVLMVLVVASVSKLDAQLNLTINVFTIAVLSVQILIERRRLYEDT